MRGEEGRGGGRKLLRWSRWENRMGRAGVGWGGEGLLLANFGGRRGRIVGGVLGCGRVRKMKEFTLSSQILV